MAPPELVQRARSLLTELARAPRFAGSSEESAARQLCKSELERAGFVTKRSTTGTFVSSAGSPLARKECIEILAGRVDALLAEARHMNITTTEVLNLVRQRDRDLDQHPSKE